MRKPARWHFTAGTRSENMKRAHALGLESLKGERHTRHKLKESEIMKIRALIGSGKKQSEVAAFYGVCQPTISKIASGKLWPHTAAQGENLVAEVI